MSGTDPQPALASPHEFVSPDSGLATDYLNGFNDYVMLAELVDQGLMERSELLEWQPLGYEAHFEHSGLPQSDQALAAYRQLAAPQRQAFDRAVTNLFAQIERHRTNGVGLEDVRSQRDRVADLIRGVAGATTAQSEIDALFD